MRFYNGGEKFEASLTYSIPNPNGDAHSVGRMILTFPKEDFVDVIDEVDPGPGFETIATRFSADLLRNYGKRGLVQVDPRHDPGKEDPERELVAKAPNDAAAIERGAKLWHEYTFAIVQAHLADCDAARSAGGAPRYASGFTKHCLRLHKITDPADRYMDSLKEGAAPAQNDALIATLQQQMAQTNALVKTLLITLASGKKLDAKAIKMLLGDTPQASGDAPAGKPIISGVVTGKVNAKPPKDNGLEHLKTPVKGKEERAKQAAAAVAEL